MIAQRLAILGVGLMGGSIARALRAAGEVGEIVGYDADARQTARAAALGVTDRSAASAADAVRGADLVLLAVPVSETRALLSACRPALDPAAVVTDVGSTKRSVIEAVRAVFGELPAGFVPGHPIAGAEKFGVEAAQADLFRGRRVILTPLPGTDERAKSRVRAMWTACGASVTEMEPQHHDEVLAATSHLPHLLAYALVDFLAAMDARREIFAYAAGGFRDFTRIASSSPKMWHDIVRANGDAIVPVLDGFLADLQGIRDAIARDDGAALLRCFENARAARGEFVRLAGTARGANERPAKEGRTGP